LLFRAGINIASLWNKKAKLWLIGRKDLFGKMKSEIQNPKSEIIWVHCSSLGEFEQGRPVIEELKSRYPHFKILLTFFSPSGYEVRKNYKFADWVYYLPLDSDANAKLFLETVNPSLVIFIKYDYWYYYLSACKERKIPLLLVSGIFRKSQPFFRWYGSFHKNMLQCITHLFVQDQQSELLLKTIDITNVTVAGDTRFDRVATIVESFLPIKEIENFCGNSKILIAGSTWPTDEKLIKEVLESFPDLKLIIAPHEIHKEHLISLKKLFPDSLFFSELQTLIPMITGTQHLSSNCLIIDNIGMLSKLYHYATLTYVGGGFDKGIHNVLEAAVHGKPVIFGPIFRKFNEAIDLINENAGFSISNKTELEDEIRLLLNEQELYSACCKNAGNYVLKNKGATKKIMEYIQLNRLLTN